MILIGDCREVLRTLPDRSVHCVVTSPPYFGLRDYGVEGQLGLEKTPQEYVANLVGVFREVRRVLRDDGTLWLNLGDSYANDGKWGGSSGGKHVSALHGATSIGRNKVATGLKPKDLIGIPWRVAFALQEDGWYLRQDNIWHKPNPMPESVRDRFVKAHEYVFLLSKGQRYYFDPIEMKEPAASAGRRSGNKARKSAAARGVPGADPDSSNGAVAGSVPWESAVRTRRSVWTVTTKPYKGAHFATFPPDLIEPCVRISCPPGGVVLDPFGGSGTVGQVAKANGRGFILIDLNPNYEPLMRQRIGHTRHWFLDLIA